MLSHECNLQYRSVHASKIDVHNFFWIWTDDLLNVTTHIDK